MAKDTRVDLKKYTVPFVVKRRDALVNSSGKRNEVMDRFESYYRMKVWADPAREGEERVTLPLALSTVEEYRSMLFARKPQISVPSDTADAASKESAEKLERYLYGVDQATNLYTNYWLGEWNACCLGQCHIKAVYDPHACADEFPVIVTSPDPRTIYFRMNDRRDRYSELVQQWERTRREIEEEWGVELGLGENENGVERPEDEERLEEWLDETVTYFEYWTEVSVFEAKAKKENPLGETLDETLFKPNKFGIDISLDASGIEIKTEPVVTEGDSKERKRTRKIVHMALVESACEDGAEWVKKPRAMVDYECIPFFSWAGIMTPMKENNGAQSLLYGLTGGDGDNDAYGVIQLQNQILTLFVSSAARQAYPAKVTNSPTIQKNGLEYGPDAINPIEPNATVQTIQEPPPPNSLMTVMQETNRLVNRLTTPEAMSGQFLNTSGAAISGMATVFMLMLAGKQHERETAIRKLLTHILKLTKAYAGLDGWKVYGMDKYGRDVDTLITSDDIPDDARVTVKLSSSFPRDDIALMTMLNNMVSAGRISSETFLDQFQKTYGLASDSPEEESKRVMSEQVTKAPQIMQIMAETLAKRVAESLAPKPPPPPPPPLMTGMPSMLQPEPVPPAPPPMPVMPPIPPPQSVMGAGGMPSSPELIAAGGNVEGALNMLDPNEMLGDATRGK